MNSKDESFEDYLSNRTLNVNQIESNRPQAETVKRTVDEVKL
jgi:hypothetical protein